MVHHSITRIIRWDSGHRVLGHEGKCRHLHGHSYTAEITVTKSLDALSRVVDFSLIKKLVGDWIDENWDHNFLCNKADPLYELILGFNTSEGHIDIFAGKQPYFMKNGNPTAEIIAEELYGQCQRLLVGEGLVVLNVRIWETPNCFADYCPVPFLP